MSQVSRMRATPESAAHPSQRSHFDRFEHVRSALIPPHRPLGEEVAVWERRNKEGLRWRPALFVGVCVHVVCSSRRLVVLDRGVLRPYRGTIAAEQEIRVHSGRVRRVGQLLVQRALKADLVVTDSHNCGIGPMELGLRQAREAGLPDGGNRSFGCLRL